MLHRCSGGLPVILEDQNVLEPPVFGQVIKPALVFIDHVEHFLIIEIGEVTLVRRRFDENFMRANTVGKRVHPIVAQIKISFDPQGGKFIGK